MRRIAVLSHKLSPRTSEFYSKIGKKGRAKQLVDKSYVDMHTGVH